MLINNRLGPLHIKSADFRPFHRTARPLRISFPFVLRSNNMSSRDIEIRLHERQIQNIKGRFYFQYGRYTSEHTVHQYVNSLARRIPQDAAKPIKEIVVVPGMKSVNAFTLPDGVILVSKGLLEFIDSEEELLGVLNHEYIHYKRAHVRKQNESMEGIVESFNMGNSLWETAKKAMSMLGQKRLHEYEGDLYGFLQNLGENGINPIGMKNFLEKLSEEEKRRSKGFSVEHGSSEQRALNIASALHMVDIKSSNEPLNPIPEDIKAGLKSDEGAGPIPGKMIDRSVYTHYNPKNKNQREEFIRRMMTVNVLSAAELQLAIDQTANIYNKFSCDVDVLSALLNRAYDLWLPQEIAENEKQSLFILLAPYFTGLSKTEIVTRMGWSGEQNEAVQGFVTSDENVLRFLEVIKTNGLNIDLPFALRDPRCIDSTFKDIIQDPKMRIKFEKGGKFYAEWQEILELFSEKYDLYARPKKSVKESEKKPQAAEKTAKSQASGNASKSNTEQLILSKADTQIFNGIIDEFNELSQTPKAYRAVLSKAREVIGNWAGSSDNVPKIRSAMRYLLEETYFVLEDLEAYLGEELTGNMGCFFVWELFNGILRSLPEDKLDKTSKNILIFVLAEDTKIKEYAGKLETSISKLESAIETLEIAEGDPFIYDSPSSEGPDHQYSGDRRLFNEMEALERQRAELEEGLDSDSVSSKELSDWKKDFKRQLRAINSSSIMDDMALLDHLVRNPIRLEALYEKLFPTDLTESKGAAGLFCKYAMYQFRDMSLKGIADELNKSEKFRDVLFDNPNQCGLIALKILDWIGQPDHSDISYKDLIALSRFITNVFVMNIFHRFIKDLFWKNLSFDEKLELLDPKNKHGIKDSETIEHFIENEVNTQKDYVKVKDLLGKIFENLSDEASAATGALALLANSDFSRRNPVQFLKALLSCRYGDRDLKTFIYQLAEDEYHRKGISGFSKTDHRARVETILENADLLLSYLYTMDVPSKHILLRHLLTENWGILKDPIKKRDFFYYIFNEWLTDDESQKEIKDLLNKIGDVVVDDKSGEVLFFALHVALLDKIAMQPAREESCLWENISVLQYDLHNRGFSEGEIYQITRNVVFEKLPPRISDEPWKFGSVLSKFASDRIYQTFVGMGIAGSSQTREKLSPMHFAKDVICHTGAPGVRFMQLLPQFAQMTPDVEREFADVYDSMRGQSKLAALSLLEREWPEFWGEIEEVGCRLGGGSIVTVYKAKTKSGNDEVLKVRNPNIEYHLNQSYDFAKNILEGLAQRHGDTYNSSLLVLDDIRTWIGSDISFDNFIEDDQVFYDRNNNWKSGRNEYQIAVPRSYSPKSEFFSREEEVKGKNLTQWDELIADGNDMKSIVSLLVKNYVAQIQSGLVHSDVHPGNFRVTKDKKVAILDRNFCLNLTKKEQELISSLFNPFAGDSKRENLLFEYLSSSNSIDNEEGTRKILNALMTHVKAQQMENAQKDLISLRQMGIKIPLTLTLLLKNINAFQKMAKKAGFSSIIEAFLWK